MYIIVDKHGVKQSEGKTRHLAWASFCEDINTFADSIAEFKKIAQSRGFKSMKVKDL